MGDQVQVLIPCLRQGQGSGAICSVLHVFILGSLWRKPMWAQGEHAHSTQKSLGGSPPEPDTPEENIYPSTNSVRGRNWSQDLLTVRQKCYALCHCATDHFPCGLHCLAFATLLYIPCVSFLRLIVGAFRSSNFCWKESLILATSVRRSCAQNEGSSPARLCLVDRFSLLRVFAICLVSRWPCFLALIYVCSVLGILWNNYNTFLYFCCYWRKVLKKWGLETPGDLTCHSLLSPDFFLLR